MPLIRYADLRLHSASKLLVERATEIVAHYASLNIAMTLRALYYQFVRRNWIPNSDKSYKNFGHTLSEARKGGFFDWDAIVDQHRPRLMPTHYKDLRDKIESSIGFYKLNRWAGQANHVVVVIEKDAQTAVFAPVCDDLHVPLFVNKGYGSSTVLWELAEYLKCFPECDNVVVLYFGDHDPSGVDMTRDLSARLDLFQVSDSVNLTVTRVALTIEQVRQYKCPPNPVMLKPKPGKTRFDNRAQAYVAKYGKQCWEMDALPPEVMRELLVESVEAYLDKDLFSKVVAREKREFAEFVRWNKKIPSYKKILAREKREAKAKAAKEKREAKKAKAKAKRDARKAKRAAK